MDIAQTVTAADKLNAYVYVSDTHISKGIVHTFYKNADGVSLSGTNYVHVADISILRARVCTPFDV